MTDQDKKYPRRFGCFSIPIDDIREHTNEVAKIFAMLNLVVVRAESVFTANTIEYEAISPQFREIEPGEAIPYYILYTTMQELEDGMRRVVSVSCEEQRDLAGVKMAMLGSAL